MDHLFCDVLFQFAQFIVQGLLQWYQVLSNVIIVFVFNYWFSLFHHEYSISFLDWINWSLCLKFCFMGMVASTLLQKQMKSSLFIWKKKLFLLSYWSILFSSGAWAITFFYRFVTLQQRFGILFSLRKYGQNLNYQIILKGFDDGLIQFWTEVFSCTTGFFFI